MCELRRGEFLLTECLGGKCCVCKERIEKGQAVQLSRYSSGIRHTTCMPKTDNRNGLVTTKFGNKSLKAFMQRRLKNEIEERTKED